MAVVEKSVLVGKEVDDVMRFVVASVKHFKDGKGVAESVELLDELMSAVTGMDQLDNELAENKSAVYNSVLLGAADLVAVLLEKKAV